MVTSICARNCLEITPDGVAYGTILFTALSSFIAHCSVTSHALDLSLFTNFLLLLSKDNICFLSENNVFLWIKFCLLSKDYICFLCEVFANICLLSETVSEYYLFCDIYLLSEVLSTIYVNSLSKAIRIHLAELSGIIMA